MIQDNYIILHVFGEQLNGQETTVDLYLDHNSFRKHLDDLLFNKKYNTIKKTNLSLLISDSGNFNEIYPKLGEIEKRIINYIGMLIVNKFLDLKPKSYLVRSENSYKKIVYIH